MPSRASADLPVVIVGAGAAGLMAAVFAAEHARVLVLERTRDGGRKILISGGGRCNILPSALEPERFVTDSPAHLLRRMLRAWPLSDQRAFFEHAVGIPLALETETGKLFPVSNRARDVRDALVALARRRGATFAFDTSVTGLEPERGHWRIDSTAGPIDARAVILATGGMSVPHTGSDGLGLRLAARLGHVVHEPYPALTPLTATPAVHAALAGVSLPVSVRAKWRGRIYESSGGLLFTHRGYSGPAVLDLCHVAVRSLMGDGEKAVLRVTWSPLDAQAWHLEFARTPGQVATVVARHVPQRLGEHLMRDVRIPTDRRGAELRREERTALIEALTAFVLPWTGHEGFTKAEVTGGGVALDEVAPRTLESRRHPGLFFCGEMLDAFGPIGGHNFAWAWTTGRAAGLGASAPGWA